MSDETKAAKPSIPFGARLKNLFIGGLLGLALGGGWAGYVWWTGSAALADAQEAHQASLVEAKKAAEALNAELDAERRKTAVLGARADVARALVALEEQNYGTVKGKLKEAAQRLDGVEGAEAIMDRLNGFTVDAADPQTARDPIQGLGAELDSLGY